MFTLHQQFLFTKLVLVLSQFPIALTVLVVVLVVNGWGETLLGQYHPVADRARGLQLWLRLRLLHLDNHAQAIL